VGDLRGAAHRIKKFRIESWKQNYAIRSRETCRTSHGEIGCSAIPGERNNIISAPLIRLEACSIDRWIDL
jgi:hypothetical protein